MVLINFYRKYWFYFCGIFFVVSAFAMIIWGENIDPVRKILILSFMALFVHQFEEYALPGGFPAVFNVAMYDEKEAPERYPLNTMSSWIVNSITAYIFYILPIIFPTWYWLGIMTMCFGFTQLIAHGFIANSKLHSIYNPGLGAVVFLHIPIGIYYIWYIAAHFNFGMWHWIVGIFGLPIAAVIIILLPITILKDKNSPYAWAPDVFNKFSVKERMDRIKAKETLNRQKR